MRRRYVIQALGTLSAAAILPRLSFAKDTSIATVATEATPFSDAVVQNLARELATKQFEPPKADLPKNMQIDYDQYRNIRFKPELAIWSSEQLPFRIELFHRGFIFADPVKLYVVADGQSRRILYSPELFTFGSHVQPPADGTLTDFSGFRIHAPINRPDYVDEFAVFQGASYFRAIAKGVSRQHHRVLAPKCTTSGTERIPPDLSSALVLDAAHGPYARDDGGNSGRSGPQRGTRRFVIDFVGGRLAKLDPGAPVAAVIETSAGAANDKLVRPNPMIGGWRVSFVLSPGDAKFCDMRCNLQLGDERLSEVWIYRWSQ